MFAQEELIFILAVLKMTQDYFHSGSLQNLRKIFILAACQNYTKLFAIWQPVKITQDIFQYGSLPKLYMINFILAVCQHNTRLFSFWQPAKVTRDYLYFCSPSSKLEFTTYNDC